MGLRLMGKKSGMTQLFDKDGNAVACTVISTEPNVITQIKTKSTDGYAAIQTGFEKIVTKDSRTAERRVGKPQAGIFKKNGITALRRYLNESRIDNVENYKVGDELTVALFAEEAYVDVMGVSKGKGYQGVIKLHNFAGGPAAHGSGFHRHAGSTGMRSSPGRCLPGGPRPSHMGMDRVTVQNLRVVAIDADKGVIIVEGAVPGPTGSLVYVSAAKKQKKQAQKKKKK